MAGKTVGEPFKDLPLGVPVGPELADRRSPERNGNAHPPRRVGLAGRRAEDKCPLVQERDRRPRDARAVCEQLHCFPEDVVWLAATVENGAELVENVRAHASRSAPSNARTASRSSSG